MRISTLIMIGVSVLAVLTCNKDDSLNQDAGKEIAKIFLLGQTTDVDVEEVRGDADNRITCKLVQTLGPGIRVIVMGSNNRRFELDFRNIQDEGFYTPNTGEALYRDENGNQFQTIGNGLQNVQIFWRENFDICEFTWDAGSSPVELRSNSVPPVFVDSLKIETLREDF